MTKNTVSGNNTLVFFVASTFGNGGPPTDAKPFAAELAKLAEDDNNNSNSSKKNILLNLK